MATLGFTNVHPKSHSYLRSVVASSRLKNMDRKDIRRRRCKNALWRFSRIMSAGYPA